MNANILTVNVDIAKDRIKDYIEHNPEFDVIPENAKQQLKLFIDRTLTTMQYNIIINQLYSNDTNEKD